MTPRDLKKRTKFVKATPLKNRVAIKKFSRKEPAYVREDEPEYAESFDNFFDFEEDLSGMKSSAELFAETNQAEEETFGFVEMQEKPQVKIDDDIAQAEKILITPVVMNEVTSDEKEPYVFKQCSKIMKEGRRCKRQAPKNSDLCSSHRKKKK